MTLLAGFQICIIVPLQIENFLELVTQGNDCYFAHMFFLE